MTSKIKNIIIFTVVAAVLILVYVLFIKKAPDQQNLVSSRTNTSSSTTTSNTGSLDQNASITKNLLSVLLSAKSIKLNDAIFSDPAFIGLRDSSIPLPSLSIGDEGRLNPFAPIGSDQAATNPLSLPTGSSANNGQISNSGTTTPPNPQNTNPNNGVKLP